VTEGGDTGDDSEATSEPRRSTVSPRTLATDKEKGIRVRPEHIRTPEIISGTKNPST